MNLKEILKFISEILISNSAFSALSNSQEGAVYTYLQVREDGVSLFGFSTPEE
ncbi:MAG: hypothetical protein K2H29_04125, partial [Oscillospiraceae bacterium]|nr:hypothetical protein [Oscillospiraceae bacterium]